VAWLVTPPVVRMVARRRHGALAQRHGGSFWGSVGQGLGSTALALIALLLTLPLWLVPPLVIVLPPLIWGWLTSRVMVYDTLAQHASAAERDLLMRRHRYPMLAIGVVAGYMGAAPGLIWALGVMAVLWAPVLVPLAIWIYTFVFIFSALWFAHYNLAALAALRAEPLTAELVERPEAGGPPSLSTHV
jgi:cadmium resistance protein CadD (predicted permease)